MNITIQGLSPRQCLFADIIWKLNGQDEVYAFIGSLPAEFRAEAQTVMNMMVAAVFDEITDTETAQQLLNRIK